MIASTRIVRTLFGLVVAGASQIGCSGGSEPAADSAASAAEDAPYIANGPIERSYSRPGPWAVATMATTDACDRKLDVCDLYYPENLGSNPLLGMSSGFRHPLISWANGSGQLAERYDYFLRHLASWGFIVVASRDTMTLGGETTIDAADYMLGQNQRAESVFFDKVDANHVGAAGHSQGGGSVVALFAHQTPPFSAFVAIHPSPHYFAIPVSGIVSTCITPEICGQLPVPDDFGHATSGAILYLNSIGDGGYVDTQMYYDETPDAATKAYGIVAQASHEDIMGTPGCRPETNCITGVYAYLGYPTAWLMWKLQDAGDGPAAFHEQTGEFNQPDPDWNFNISNVR